MPAQGSWERNKRGKFRGKIDANTIPIDIIVSSLGGEVRQGRASSVKCCLHSDTRRSAVINTYDNLYYCHTCGKGGNAVNIIQILENLEFKDALNRAIEILDRSGQPVRGSGKRRNSGVSKRTWHI